LISRPSHNLALHNQLTNSAGVLAPFRVNACNPLLQAHPTRARDKHEGHGIPPLTPVSLQLLSPLRAPSRADPSGLGHAAIIYSSVQGPPGSKHRQVARCARTTGARERVVHERPEHGNSCEPAICGGGGGAGIWESGRASQGAGRVCIWIWEVNGEHEIWEVKGIAWRLRTWEVKWIAGAAADVGGRTCTTGRCGRLH
jgi:hypothetical protein